MIRKVCLILFMLIMIFSVYSNQSNAAGDIIEGADKFLEDKGSAGEGVITLDTDDFKEPLDMIYNIFLGIGIVVAVICAVILGIQYMTGSIEAQAKVKESLIPFVIGCVVIFGAFGIWKLAVTIGKGLA